MKANRKVRIDDEAVSPVIAVILMVAITVVLAATVYVWVSGFGASGSQAKNLTASVSSTAGNAATLSVVSVSPNFEWKNLKIVIDGATGYGVYANGVFTAGAWTSTAAGTIAAGDIIKLAHQDGAGAVTVKFVDTAANTQVASMTVNVGADSDLPTASATTGATPTVTFSKAMYLVNTGITANDELFAFTDGSTAGDDLTGAAITTWSQGGLNVGIAVAGTGDNAAMNTDTLTHHGTNKWYDLAGNEWTGPATWS